MAPVQPSSQQNSTADFQRILAEHAARYPRMEAQDYGKLLFQHVFGPEHLLTDPDRAILWIAKEQHEVSEAHPTEDIGNGLSRIYLDPMWTLEAFPLLVRLMVRSAAEVHGTREDLEDKLPLLGDLPVPGMAEWLAQWKAAGCPAVHHSETYREAYHPHYRLLRTCYATVFPVISDLASMIWVYPVVMAIDGRCGSGKTWLASLLAELFPCRVIHMDDFYRPMDQRDPHWREIPAGNMDLQRLRDEILEPAWAGEDILYRPYSCQKGAYLPAEVLPPQPLTIVEGSYSLHPDLREYYNARKVFLTCSPEVQAARLQRREGPHYSSFVDTWIPMEERYYKACTPDKICTHLIDTSACF